MDITQYLRFLNNASLSLRVRLPQRPQSGRDGLSSDLRNVALGQRLH
jgi:hypothetical protein